MHPYQRLPSYHFWRTSVSQTLAHEFDPIVEAKFQVSRSDRVSTAGSCFAQHISRELQRLKFNYYLAEPGDEFDELERNKRQYGIYSARYGNIYTSRQLKQLIEEAYGQRKPAIRSWANEDGRFIDPYRPNVEPGGFASLDSLQADRSQHLEAVRDIVQTSDVFIFTLGLTETWLCREDGSALPLAPGVAGGSFNPSLYEFVNLTVDEVIADMSNVFAFMKEKNPALKALLTVSPVPLAATYERKNVVTATTYSKSVLRVAADVLASRFSWVDYFPSYEIITGSQARGLYYNDDCRNVTDSGVAHAMRIFRRHYTDDLQSKTQADIEGFDLSSRNARPAFRPIVCDEETIERISFSPNISSSGDKLPLPNTDASSETSGERARWIEQVKGWVSLRRR